MARASRTLTRRGRAIAASALLALAGVTAAALVTLAAPSVADAADAKPIAVYVEWPNADATRDEVLSVVPSGLKVLDEDTFSEALRKQGQKGQMGNVMAQAKQRGKLIARIRKATEKAGAQGAIIARVRKTRTGGRELWILFVEPGSDDLAIDKAVPLADEASERKSELKSALDPVLRDLPGASSEPEKDDPDKGAGDKEGDKGEGEGKEGEDGDEDEKDSGPSWRTPNQVDTAIFIVGLSFQTGGRFFDYSDGLTGNLRPYSVFGAPMGMVNLEFYPIGLAGDIPAAKDIGITGSYMMAFGLDSATEGGEPVNTTFFRVNAGLRGRIRFEDSPSPVLGINAGFSLMNFTYDVEGTLAGEVPQASYKLLRFGLDTRIPAGPLALELEGAFLLPLSSGEVYDRFTDPGVLGIEGRAGVGVPVGAGFEIRLAGEYTRFFSSFAPVVGDAYVAGGALDQFIVVRVGAAYAY